MSDLYVWNGAHWGVGLLKMSSPPLVFNLYFNIYEENIVPWPPAGRPTGASSCPLWGRAIFIRQTSPRQWTHQGSPLPDSPQQRQWCQMRLFSGIRHYGPSISMCFCSDAWSVSSSGTFKVSNVAPPHSNITSRAPFAAVCCLQNFDLDFFLFFSFFLCPGGLLRYAAWKCHHSDLASLQTFRQMSIRLCCSSHRKEKSRLLKIAPCQGIQAPEVWFACLCSPWAEDTEKRSVLTLRQSGSAVLPTTRR